MKSLVLLLAVTFCLPAQQPFLYFGGAYHAATYTPAGLPNAGLPRGGLFTVFGRNLGPASAATASAFPLPTNLAGVRLQVLRGTQSFDALPVFVSASQINAILPSNTPLGRSLLRLQFNAATSNTIPIEVVQSNFGAFSVNSGGFGPAIVTNFISQQNQPLNSLEQAAQPGQTITLWGTGLGPVSFPDNVAPTAGDLNNDVTVYIGGVPATRLYAGRAPCCAGLDQIVVTIPSNVPQSCWVPVQVRVAGLTSNTTTIAVAPTPTSCADPLSRFSSLIRQGGKMARLLTTRSQTRVDINIPNPITLSFDSAIAQFAEYSANPFAWQLFDSLPPPGACVTYSSRGVAHQFAKAIPGLNGTPIDPGDAFSISGLASRMMTRIAGFSHLFYTNLSTPSQLFFPLNQELRITGAGSPAVPAFSGVITPNFTNPWTNRDASLQFATNQPITLTWTPQASGLVLAIGSSFLPPRNVSGFFACAARSEDGRLTVPSYIVSTLPREALFTDSATAMLALAYVPNPSGSPLTLPGFTGSIIHLNVQERTVRFR